MVAFSLSPSSGLEIFTCLGCVVSHTAPMIVFVTFIITGLACFLRWVLSRGRAGALTQGGGEACSKGQDRQRGGGKASCPRAWESFPLTQPKNSCHASEEVNATTVLYTWCTLFLACELITFKWRCYQVCLMRFTVFRELEISKGGLEKMLTAEHCFEVWSRIYPNKKNLLFSWEASAEKKIFWVCLGYNVFKGRQKQNRGMKNALKVV